MDGGEKDCCGKDSCSKDGVGADKADAIAYARQKSCARPSARTSTGTENGFLNIDGCSKIG